MRCFALCLAGVLATISASCEAKFEASKISSSSARPPSGDASIKERALGLARKIRDEMTKPEIMALDDGATADTSLRGQRQRELAQPLMRKLLECGQAAEEPLWQLINDPEASVRRSCVILLDSRVLWNDESGKVIQSQVFNDLNIPLLEKSLSAKDNQIRYFACGALGNYATYSDECLARASEVLHKLRMLRKDNDQKVRSTAHSACVFILGGLAERAKKPEDRKAAADALKQLQQEKW